MYGAIVLGIHLLLVLEFLAVDTVPACPGASKLVLGYTET